MVGSSFPGVGVSSHAVYRPERFLLGVVDGYDRLPDFSYSLCRLDFSHCAAYQSASIKCFIRAWDLLRVRLRGQPAKSLCVSLRLPLAHEEEWVKRQRRAS